jgi:hypothetical protein
MRRRELSPTNPRSKHTQSALADRPLSIQLALNQRLNPVAWQIQLRLNPRRTPARGRCDFCSGPSHWSTSGSMSLIHQ